MPVYKNESTGMWYTKFRYRDWEGSMKYKTKRGFKTRREAAQWETEFKARIAGDLEMKFGDFVELYEDERFPRLKASTRSMKKYVIDNKILPYFRDFKLNEITPTDIVKWQNDLLECRDPKTGKPYTKSYLKTVHNQLNAIFSYACRYYKLSQNPAAIAGNIGGDKDIKMHFWTLDQYLAFSEEMMYEPMAYEAFQVLYWLGIREGEMMALMESDFDFDNKTVSITKTYQVVRGVAMITPPKTTKSNRTVKVPDFLCEELKEYIAKIPDLKPDDRIFEGVSKSYLYRHIRSGAKRAGLPQIRVHDLRHSHVSLLIQMGYNAVAIADRMGHESITITFRYAHMFPTIQTDMAADLNKLMEDKTNVKKDT